MSAGHIPLVLSDDEAIIVLAVLGKHCFEAGLFSPYTQKQFADRYGALNPPDRDMGVEVAAVCDALLGSLEAARAK